MKTLVAPFGLERVTSSGRRYRCLGLRDQVRHPEQGDDVGEPNSEPVRDEPKIEERRKGPDTIVRAENCNVLPLLTSEASAGTTMHEEIDSLTLICVRISSTRLPFRIPMAMKYRSVMTYVRPTGFRTITNT